MTQETYTLLEAFMRNSMADSAHDTEHVYRVLWNALAIAKTEESIDYDVLITACLLHDIGRREQIADSSLCHAEVGAQKAYNFLLAHGWREDFAEQVRHCILTHRFRKNRQPETLEAKILFDADKLDVTGALGIARTLMYKGTVVEPLYTKRPDGSICDGENTDVPSFFREYKFKLEKLYGKFYTAEGARLAASRQAIARDFYQSLYREVNCGYRDGQADLHERLKP